MAGEFLPYFRFFPAETLADERFSGWTLEERGAWFSLILHAWVNGSIPSDVGAIARILHVDAVAMRSLWGVIADRFVQHPDKPDRLTSRRLELEREEVIAKSEAGRKGANSRWHKANPVHTRESGRNAVASGVAMPTDQSRTDQSRSENSTSAEPNKSARTLVADTSPVVAVLPCKGKGPSEFPVTESRLNGWRDAYPGLDLAVEVRKARAWLEANPTRAKTHGGMAKFLVGWFDRAQNRNPNRNPAPKEDPRDAALKALRDRRESELAGSGDGSGAGDRDGEPGAAGPRPAPEVGARLSATVDQLLGPGWTAGGVQDRAGVEHGAECGGGAPAGPVRQPGAHAR